MSIKQDIAVATVPVIQGWLERCSNVPLVLRAGEDGSIRFTMGLADDSRLTLRDTAALLGYSEAHFRRAVFFGLERGKDKRFSRLQAERLKASWSRSGRR